MNKNDPSGVNIAKLPWKGGCQCGEVRYEISQMPLTLYACHCTECQKQSASAFGLSLWVRKSAFRVSGNTKSWSRGTDRGNILHCHFCPRCGSRLWHEGDKPHPTFGPIVSVKGGSLGNMKYLAPVGHIWTRSKLPGTILPNDSLQFEADRIDDDALVRAWHAYLSEVHGISS